MSAQQHWGIQLTAAQVFKLPNTVKSRLCISTTYFYLDMVMLDLQTFLSFSCHPI